MPSRKSTTTDADDNVLHDRDEVALQEARNGLLQFDEVLRLADEHAPAKYIALNPNLILRLNEIAIAGISRSAGQFRGGPVRITNTVHIPPPAAEVPSLVSAMCEYVDANWVAKHDDLLDAIHLAAYLMWRLNWIHPFVDGNGRTSRAVSYLALSVRLGALIPGSPTIADQIVDNRQPYYEALDAADLAWASSKYVDVSQMEALINRLLTNQLASFSVS